MTTFKSIGEVPPDLLPLWWQFGIRGTEPERQALTYANSVAARRAIRDENIATFEARYQAWLRTEEPPTLWETLKAFIA